MNTIKMVILVMAGIILLPSFLFGGNDTQETKNIKKHTITPSPDKNGGKQKENLINDRDKRSNVGPAKNELPLYKPQVFRGAPVVRVAGGSRGIKKEQYPALCVLTPDHTGLTLQKQPSLYYFLSKTTNHPIELTIMEDRNDAIYPTLEVRISHTEVPGIQFIHLNDFDIYLQKGVPYKWHVSIIPDLDNRAKDILAWGRIERVEMSVELNNVISRTSQNHLAHVYADAGIWYDAFSSISKLIETDPFNSLWKKQRVSLLEQVGLQQVAQFEMDMSSDF